MHDSLKPESQLGVFYSALRCQPLYRASVALNASPSLPVPVVHEGRLFVGVLLLRTTVEERGRISVFEPEGSIVATWDGARVARFENWRILDEPSDDSAPLCSFPPASIGGWSRTQYAKARETYFASFPGFADFVQSRGEEGKQAASSLVTAFDTLTEPELGKYYARVAPTFASVAVHLVPSLKERFA